MSLIDNIRGFFSGSKSEQAAQPQSRVNEEYEKSRLADKIVDTVHEIERINSFDSSLWNLSHVSSYDLKRKSLNELERLNSSLENRLSELTRPKRTTDSKMAELESSKWTGQKPKGMSDIDFDRFQRYDDGR